MTNGTHYCDLGSTESPGLSLMVPALNEASNLGPTVERLRQALRPAVADYEIIVIDDGSSDGTAAVADRLADSYPEVRVVHHEHNMGLGYSYQEGVALAQKSHYVFIPGDNTWPLESLCSLFANLGKADIVTSYSTNPEIRPWGRRLVSRLYTRTLNLLFGQRMHYYNGLTIYPLAFLKTCPITTRGFGFQAEILLEALYRGLSAVEVPLPIDERAAGGSKAVKFKNICSVVSTVVRLFWRLRVLGRREQQVPVEIS